MVPPGALLKGILLALAVQGCLLAGAGGAIADDRAVAFEQERRWFAGFAGATSQTRFTADGTAGSSTTALADGLLVRFGRFGRPTRYGMDTSRVRYDQAEMWTTTAYLDYVFAGGGLFSGYLGVTVGYGTLRWRGRHPFDGEADFRRADSRQRGPVAGLRAGGLIEVTDLVQVEIGYRYLWTDFEERFDNDSGGGSVTASNQRAIHAGVNFRFR